MCLSCAKKLFPFLLIYLAVTKICAQYKIASWTADEGLPQNSVQAIVQTRDGYLWLTTSDGLVRYDGVRFKVFNRSNTEGINNNRFNVLLESADGDLWAGTEEGGVTRYHKGKFKTYTTEDGLPGNWIVRIENLSDGSILFLTDRGLARFKDEKFEPYELAADENMSRFIHVDREGGIWYANSEGLHRLKNSNLTTYPISIENLSFSNTQIFTDSQGSVWVSKYKSGVFRLHNGEVKEYGVSDGLPDAFVSKIIEDSAGNLWFATRGNGGLVRYRAGVFTRITTEQGLSSNDVSAICEDREGNLWVGTGNRGLNRLTRQTVETISTRDGLVNDNVYPIFEDSAGRIWIGTTSGLSKYENGKLTSYTRKDGLKNGIIQSFYEDSKGRLWIGWMGGAGWFENGRIVDFTDKLGLKFNNLWTIYEDKEGNYWFGTDLGLIRIRNGVSTVYTTKDGLPGDDVKIIHEDRAGNLWLGIYGGIAVLEKRQKSENVDETSEPFYPFKLSAVYTTRNGLASNFVRTISEDADGVLWIGTYDHGLLRFKDGKFTNYTTADGLFNDGVFRILEDSRGNLWMSSNRGISRVSKKQLNDFADGKIKSITAVSYGKKDGMLDAECNGGRQPAGIKARDGRLWFPTQAGVAIINPETVPYNQKPPPVVIEEVIVDRQPIDWQESQIIEIGPDKTNFEIHYTGLSFVKPESVSFKYKLEGLDADWVEAGTRRVVYFAHLPPGEYAFRVIAANSDGVWNMEGATIRLKIIPPFYRTTWFIVLAVLTVIGLIVFTYRRREAQLRKEKAQQELFSRLLIESQERERGRIAAELHDGLSQSLVIIKNRAMLSLTTPEDKERAFEQLEEISEAASEAMLEAKEIIYNLRPIQLDRFGLTKAIKAMLKKVCEGSGLELIAEVETIDGLLSKEAESSVYRILQESINNIVRHSEATKAYVSIKRKDGFIEMLIEDNGKGFELEKRNLSENLNGGFGLIGIVERARLLKGSAEIKSEIGKGTTIRVSLPLAKDFSKD